MNAKSRAVKVEAIGSLAEINDFDREIELTRQNKRLMKYLERRARQTKTVPLAQVKAELGLE